MMTHEEIQADLSLFALGSLDSDERRQIEQHLGGGCPACERDLQDWNEVLGAVALAGTERPAPVLRERLLNRARGTRRTARVIRLPRWTAVPAAAAAAIAALIGIKLQGDLRTQLEEHAELAGRLYSELNQVQKNFLAAKKTLAARERDVDQLRAALASAEESLAIVQRPGLQLVRLDKTSDAPPAEAHVLVAGDTRQALFYAFGLPALPQGKTYELWWITENEGPLNAGLFVPDDKGLGRLDTGLPRDAGAIKAAAVTIEPWGGVEKPTGPMVLLGSITTAL